IRCSQGKEAGLGPIGQAASERGFHAIELISNDAAGVCNAYVDWLQNLTSAEITVHKATLSSPMNFGEIYETADRVVAHCMERGAKQLVFHLSPGTSAMTAMWLVLATTKYNAELIASSLSTGVYTPDFPFEIAADYLPRRRSAVKGKHVRELFEDRTPPAFDNIVHRCDAMKRVIDRAQRVAGFDVPVMILGGKPAREKNCSRKPSITPAHERELHGDH
ncbi:MAG: hypothetical protein ACK50J_21080, partial [Planctomyces sp.]